MPKILRKRWFRILSVLLLIVLVLVILHWPAPVKIIISHDTTRITGPVNPDGTINYVAALNEEYGKGVTAENNAAILIIRALGPEFLVASMRNQVLEKLEMDPLPEVGDYFVSLDDYENDYAADEKARSKPASLPVEDEEDVYTILQKVLDQPWSAKEYPLIAAWLKANEKPLAIVTAAAKRPRFYLPLVSQSDPPRIIDTILPSLSSYKEVSRALIARSMLKMKAGDIEGAWADIMTVRHLARLFSQNSILVIRLVGIAVEALGCEAANTMAISGKLSAGQAKAFLTDLKSLPPLPDVAEAIDRGERFFMLDCVMLIYSGGNPDIGSPSGVRLPKTNLIRSAIDWNEVLRVDNHWRDRLVEALRKPTFAKRNMALATVEDELSQLVDRTKSAGGITKVILCKIAGRPLRKRLSRMMANLLVSITIPSLSRSSEIYLDVLMRTEISKLAMALAVYKGQNGNYPDKLEALAPAILKAIPLDLFTDKPLKYQRLKAGYLLYSVGPNTNDDGGSDDRKARHDDIPARAEK